MEELEKLLQKYKCDRSNLEKEHNRVRAELDCINKFIWDLESALDKEIKKKADLSVAKLAGAVTGTGCAISSINPAEWAQQQVVTSFKG